MLKLASAVVLLLCVAIACADPASGAQKQQQLQRQLRSGAAVASVGSGKHPYLFLTVPRANGDGHAIQGFRVVEDDDEKTPLSNINNDDHENESSIQDDDDDDDDADDDKDTAEHQDDDEDNDNDNSNNEFEYDDDEDDDDNMDIANNLVYLRSRIPHTPRLRSQMKKQATAVSMKASPGSQFNAQLVLKNAKPTNMMVSRDHAGSIMVPDGFIEIEGQSVLDEKTGKTSLLVPRNVLDAIPEGSVVALVDNSAQDTEEARANRVIVRRRRKGSRRNVVRRRGGVRRNRRRRGGQRRNVRVYRIGGSNRRRRNRRPVLVQG